MEFYVQDVDREGGADAVQDVPVDESGAPVLAAVVLVEVSEEILATDVLVSVCPGRLDDTV